MVTAYSKGVKISVVIERSLSLFLKHAVLLVDTYFSTHMDVKDFASQESVILNAFIQCFDIASVFRVTFLEPLYSSVVHNSVLT